jgi:hypothetical protein
MKFYYFGDKSSNFTMKGVKRMGFLKLSLRGESGARDAAIHRVSGRADGFVSSLTGSQWIATGLRPRDDKGGVFYHEGNEEVKFSFCHCEEDGRTTRQSIVFRESERGWRFAYWLTVDRHGLRPRDDKGGENGILGCEFTPGLRPRDDKGWYFHHEGSEVIGAFTFVIARRERERTTRQSIVSWWMRAELSVRSLRVSGSPRACSPRDDNIVNGLVREI